jgi:hypothetical protein
MSQLLFDGGGIGNPGHQVRTATGMPSCSPNFSMRGAGWPACSQVRSAISSRRAMAWLPGTKYTRSE